MTSEVDPVDARAFQDIWHAAARELGRRELAKPDYVIDLEDMSNLSSETLHAIILGGLSKTVMAIEVLTVELEGAL